MDNHKKFLIHNLTLLSIVWLSACATTNSVAPAAFAPAVSEVVAPTSVNSKIQPELELDPCYPC